MSHYKETLAELRAARIDERRDEILTERVSLEQQYRDARQRALDLAALNDFDSAKWYDATLEDIEGQIAQCDSQLDEFDRAQRPADGLLPSERRYIQENPDVANQPGVEKTAAFYSDYLEQLGYARGTTEHLDGMRTVLEPAGYEKPWTPDDVCAALNLSPDEYNKNAERLWRLKSAGEYPDK